MQKEINDPQVESITKLDMLYYQAEVQIQQKELQSSSSLLMEAATLAKRLRSRLYFNKRTKSYHQLQTQWQKEALVTTLRRSISTLVILNIEVIKNYREYKAKVE